MRDQSFDLYAPAIPFSERLPDGLQMYKTLYLEGVGTGDRFSINFVCADEDSSVFHYDVRFTYGERNTVVLNAKKNGKWGPEDVHPLKIQQNRPFKIQVHITPQCLIISSNQQPTIKFPYRGDLTPEKVRKLLICDAIKISRVYYGYRQQPVKDGDLEVLAVPDGMQFGQQILIKGTVLPSFERIVVNLAKDDNNVPLHISARFGENAVVRNTKDDGRYGKEERDGQFPFHKNREFTLQIISDFAGFKISVNGNRFAEYAHRMDAKSIQWIKVEGLAVKDMTLF